MQTCRLEACLGKLMLNSSRTLHRVAENNGACVVLARILLIFLHQQLQGLHLIVVSDVDELVLQVTKVQMGRLFNKFFKGTVWEIPAFLLTEIVFCHTFHLLAYCC